MFDLPIPFFFGTYEDSPKMPALEKIITNMAGVLIRRDPYVSQSGMATQQIHPKVVQYINSCLFQDVVADNAVTAII